MALLGPLAGPLGHILTGALTGRDDELIPLFWLGRCHQREGKAHENSIHFWSWLCRLVTGTSIGKKGWQIRGTTRTPSKLTGKIGIGWEILPFAGDKPLANPNKVFSDVDVIISTISAIEGSDLVLDLHGRDSNGFSGWAGYISATSVYPDMPNGICYEDTPVAPQPPAARLVFLPKADGKNSLVQKFSVPPEFTAQVAARLMR